MLQYLRNSLQIYLLHRDSNVSGIGFSSDIFSLELVYTNQPILSSCFKYCYIRKMGKTAHKSENYSRNYLKKLKSECT